MPEPGPDNSMSSPPARPNPPRYWWLRRVLLVAAAFVLLFGALRVWWGWHAERRLREKIEELRAMGQPVTVEDFRCPAVPDEENAAKLLDQAALAVVHSVEESRFDLIDIVSDPILVTEYPEEIRRLVEANTEVLRLVRPALAGRRTDWGVRLTSPVMNVRYTHLHRQRRLAMLCCLAALHNHQSGDDAAALERINDVLEIGRRASEPQGTLIPHIVSQAISRLAVETLERMIPTMRVKHAEGDTAASESLRGADRRNVEALIESLLYETALRESWRRGMRGDRLEWLDLALLYANGRAGIYGTPGNAVDRAYGIAFGPMHRLDAVRLLDAYVAVEAAGLAVDWPTGLMMIPRADVPDSEIGRFTRIASDHANPTAEYRMLWNYRTYALRRMAATALAIRLYELDTGKRPDRLSELVPDYLPTGVNDPCARDGAPLGYRPDGPRPLLYSVSRNAVDDAGDFDLEKDGGVEWTTKDIPFFLDGDRPRPLREPEPPAWPTSAQTVEDDHGIEEDQRQPHRDQANRDDP